MAGVCCCCNGLGHQATCFARSGNGAVDTARVDNKQTPEQRQALVHHKGSMQPLHSVQVTCFLLSEGVLENVPETQLPMLPCLI